jgi:FAD-linked oxidoreductase
MDLRNCARVLAVDRERMRVTVQSGIRLHTLNRALDALDMALPNLGDIAYQSISGATATATHGTGARLGNLATGIVGLRLVDGRGEVRELNAESDPEGFRAAQVSVGALGIVSQVTLQCVPAFHLLAREGAERVDALLENLDAEVDGHDHFEFFWVPHTGWALTKRNDRTERPLAPRGVWPTLRDDLLYSNAAFGALCFAASLRPEWTPRLARMMPGSPPAQYVDKSWRVFASPRLVRFVEMEWALPREVAAEALGRIRAWLAASDLRILFPVEVRFVAGDDIPLSPAYGRDTAYLAVHVYRRRGPAVWEPYFRAVSEIARELGGRPHWGKLHFETAESLAPRYPAWDAWQEVRNRFDPERVFTTPAIVSLLGP